MDADSESKVIDDTTEWQFANYAFNEISNNFGPFEKYLFALRINAKCNIHCSWHRINRQVIREAFRRQNAPESAFDTIVALITDSIQ